MAASGATGSGFRARAGTLTLLFIVSTQSYEDLLAMLERALSGGLLRSPEGDLPDEEELDEEAGLEEYDDDQGADHQMPMSVSSKGEQLLYVAFVLKRWLGNCPSGPLQIGPEAGEVIAPLVCGWSATVTHALGAEPLTMKELERAVGILGGETLEEHIEAMAAAGLLEVQPGSGEARYTVTRWGREGLAPIAAAARLESHYPAEDIAPPDILDVEAAFQLILPLLRLPADLYGSCRFGVRIPGDPLLLAGATVEVDRGAVVSSSPLLGQEAETYATGSPADWLDTLIDPSADRVEAGGDVRLVRAVLQSMHEALFAIPVR